MGSLAISPVGANVSPSNLSHNAGLKSDIVIYFINAIVHYSPDSLSRGERKEDAQYSLTLTQD